MNTMTESTVLTEPTEPPSLNELPAEGFPLSQQQRWVCRWQGPEEAIAAVAQVVIELEGLLDRGRLELALRHVASTHEVLRTRYWRQGGFRLPFQVIEDAEGVQLSTPEPTTVVDVEALMEAQAKSFGPTSTGLRGTLIPVAEERAFLLLSMPALSADAATLEDLPAAILKAYLTAHEHPEQEEQEDEPIQYADYGDWQEEILAEDAGEAGRAWWQEHAGAQGDAVRLPFEYPTPDDTSIPSSTSRTEAAPGLIESGERCAAALGVDPAAVWLACWAMLLGRRSERNEPTVAARFDGRHHEELAGALGYFTRWLPVTIGLGASTSFQDLVRRSSSSLTENAERQDFATEDLFSDSATPRYGFEIERPRPPLRFGDLTVQIIQRHLPEPPRVATLSVSLGGTLSLRHNPKRLAPEDADRLLRELQTVAARAFAAPQCRLASLDLIDDDERNRLLQAFQPITPTPGPWRPIQTRIHAATVARGDHPAVVCADERLDYATLGARAGTLSRALIRLSIGPEDRVAICLERSVDLVAAMFGVLQTGAAYVPIDPQQPSRRIAMILDDVAPAAVLTRGGMVERVGSKWDNILLAEDLFAAREQGPLDELDIPPLAGRPDTLAYIIFTSGSTGRPKGVAVTHGALARYVDSVTARLRLPVGGNYAAVSSLAADLAHTMVFPALATGGTLHVLPVELATDPDSFVRYFDTNAIDCLKIVPSHLQALHQSSTRRVLPRARLVVGGETAKRTWIASLLEDAKNCRVDNHYGPSETTVGVLTQQAIPSALDPRCASLPLGTPLPGTQVYVLDSKLRPVPIWVPGEVFIGGETLARGYLGHPGQTAERFLPDPWSREPGGRLYRTGDRARRIDPPAPEQPDGRIEFLGRFDRQTKLHGFRIELEEIAAALNEHRTVRDSVARILIQQDAVGEGHVDRPTLVAYYVSRHPLEVAELRAFLGERVLEETIPNLFVHLRRMPLSLNGKINFDALPDLPEIRRQLAEQHVPPTSPVERGLAAIWADVLGLARIGARDNFFELGGHSLLATRAIARMRQAFAIELPLSALFSSPILSDLATEIDALSPRLDVDGHDAEPGRTSNAPTSEALAPEPTVPELDTLQEDDDGGGDIESQLAALEAMNEDEASNLLDG